MISGAAGGAAAAFTILTMAIIRADGNPATPNLNALAEHR